MAQFNAGDKVTWHYVSNQGYGFEAFIPGTVVQVSKKRVQIEVPNPYGHRGITDPVKRWVMAKSLEARE